MSKKSDHVIGNNQIFINVFNDQVSISFQKKMNIDQYLQTIFTAALSGMQGMVRNAPKDLQRQILEDLYDKFNYGASNLLTLFAPDIELRPSLTEQAILEAENNIIEREFQKSQQGNSPLADLAAESPEDYVTLTVGNVTDPHLQQKILTLYGEDVASDPSAQVQIPRCYLASAHEEACFADVP